jgi:sodium/solute symporter, putative
MASFQSSVTILGYPAEMYLKGTQFWMVILSAVVASVTAAELFLPVYYKLSFTSVNKVKLFCNHFWCLFLFNQRYNKRHNSASYYFISFEISK